MFINFLSGSVKCFVGFVSLSVFFYCLGKFASFNLSSSVCFGCAKVFYRAGFAIGCAVLFKPVAGAALGALLMVPGALCAQGVALRAGVGVFGFVVGEFGY